MPYFTTMAGADAAVEGIALLRDGESEVKALQEYQTIADQMTRFKPA